MSCFVVTPYHVNAIVSWAVHRDCLAGLSPDALAFELYTSNAHAFSERYQGRYDSETEAWPGFELVPQLGPVAIVKACDCLDYQASDWTGWRDSHAAACLAGIRAACLVALGVDLGRMLNDGDAVRHLPGYDLAAWCLESADAAGGQA